MSRGILVIISGPAGSGKGTVVKSLREMLPNLALSVSATTRTPRPGEEEGVNYYYKTREMFEEMLENGEILEHTEYMGNYYGTPASEVSRCLDAGLDLVLEIEVDGACQIKKLYPESVAVMLIPPDSRTLEARLRGRGTESEEVIVGRLARAHEELAMAPSYDYVVVNGEGAPEECAARICAIIDAEKSRFARMTDTVSAFFK